MLIVLAVVLIAIFAFLASVHVYWAIGDFRLVGFFKTIRGSRFALLDSALYSPLCLALALGVFLVAWKAGA